MMKECISIDHLGLYSVNSFRLLCVMCSMFPLVSALPLASQSTMLLVKLK